MHRTVVVGSMNPIKIAAVTDAFELVYPQHHWQIMGIDVSSGVEDQPIGEERAFQGALNRAHNAGRHDSHAHYSVGIENGAFVVQGVMMDSAWVIIVGLKEHTIGRAKTLAYQVPFRPGAWPAR